MSNWEAKSNSSFAATNKLIAESLSNTSVHCSYYSCVQYVFHIFHAYYGDSIEFIENQSKSNVNNMGTHKWMRKTMYDSMRKVNAEDAESFYSNMGILVDRRAAADYKHELITPDEALEVRQLAYETRQLLKKNFVI